MATVEWVAERKYDEILYETYNGIAKSPLTVHMLGMHLLRKQWQK